MKLDHHCIYEICFKPKQRILVFIFVRDTNGDLTTMQRFTRKTLHIAKDDIISIKEVFDENN